MKTFRLILAVLFFNILYSFASTCPDEFPEDAIVRTVATAPNIDVIKCLMDKGANPNAVNEAQNVNALYVAADKGYFEITKLLLEKNVDLNVQVVSSNYTALIRSILSNHTTISSYLIEKGADIHISAADGTNALYWAVDHNHTRVAKMLIKNGADVHHMSSRGNSILLRAVASNNLPLVKALITKGVDINQQNHDEQTTALIFAANQGHSAIVSYLLSHGANVTIQDRRGFTALITATNQNHTETVATILTHPNTTLSQLLNMLDTHNETALHHAIKLGHTPLFHTLLQYEADLWIRGRDGLYPLHYAVVFNRTDILNTLIDVTGTVSYYIDIPNQMAFVLTLGMIYRGVFFVWWIAMIMILLSHVREKPVPSVTTTATEKEENQTAEAAAEEEDETEEEEVAPANEQANLIELRRRKASVKDQS